MSKPLEDLRVLEVGNGDCLAAIGAILSDLGADVVKAVTNSRAESDLHVRLHNRGKSLMPVPVDGLVDAVTPVLPLTEVLITDLTSGELAALRLDPESVAARAPLVVHAQMTSFGSGDDRRLDDNAVYFTFAGAAGLMSERPLTFAAGQGARSAAFALTTAILVALRQRDETGRGHAVSSSIFAAGVYSVANDVTVAQGSGDQPARHDRDRPLNPLGNSYRAKDGKWLLMGAASGAGQDSWRRFCGVMDDEAWLDDERFATPELRRANTSALVARLDVAFSKRTRDDWGARLTRAGFNWNPIAEPAEAVADAQIEACGVFADSVDGPVLATPLFLDHRPLEPGLLGHVLPEEVTARWDRALPLVLGTGSTESLPLEGLKVLDVSNYVAGPGVGSLLVDLGAEVIKVEPPEGDPRRRALTHLVPGDPEGLNRAYHMDNRGKLSVALDLKQSADLEKLKALAGRCDVFLTNLLPQRQRNFGLAPDELLALNPKVVYVSLSAHGASGPDAELGGFDVTAFFARSGLLGLLTRQVDAPPRSRSGQGDHIATLVMMTGLLAALRQRDRTGRGRVVDTSLLAVGAYTIGESLLRAKLGQEPDRVHALRDYYQTRDGRWLQAAVPGDRGETNLDERAPSSPNAPDSRSRDDLTELLGRGSQTDGQGALDALGIPSVLVHSLPEMLERPEARRSELFGQMTLPSFGPIGIVGAPYWIDGAPADDYAPGPEIGEHGEEIMARLAELEKSG